MIKIGNEWVAAHQVASISPHPRGDAVCVVLVGGRELRMQVLINEGETRESVAARLAGKVDQEMRRANQTPVPD